METISNRISEVARTIVESDLAESLVSYNKESLTEIARAGWAGSAKGFAVEFRGAGTYVNLYYTIEYPNAETNESGDVYHAYEPTANVSWPSHGSSSPSVAAARLAFMTQVNDLASKLNITPFRVLHKTAAEVEAAKVERAAREKTSRENSVARDAIRYVCKSMRVGSIRDVPLKLVEELKGTDISKRVIDLDGKSYVLTVFRSTAEVKRVS